MAEEHHANPWPRPGPAGAFVINLPTLALIFGTAAPLVGVVSSFVLLKAEVEGVRAEQIRLQAQFERAMQEHREIRQHVDYLCITRRRDEREANRPDDPRAC